MKIKDFFNNNKVFLTGLASAILVVLQQYVGSETVDYKVLGLAVFSAVMAYVANQWRGQGVTIAGIVGTLATAFLTVNQGGKFTWIQLGISALVAFLASVAPPPKNKSYETSTIIQAAENNPQPTEVNIPHVTVDVKPATVDVTTTQNKKTPAKKAAKAKVKKKS